MGADSRTISGTWVPCLLPATAGALGLAIYVAILAPTVVDLDSPELSAAALTLGVPHPTGYPLFMLLGHAWTQVFAVGDPAWRVNLLSALFGAGAVAVGFTWDGSPTHLGSAS